jgi:3-dehydroquinate dehydratase
MNKQDANVFKIAVMPKSQKDIKIIYKLSNYHKQIYPKKKFIFISMGEL